MPDWSFLDDGQGDDGTIRISTSRAPRARPKVKTFTQSLDDAQRGLDGCAKQLYGCGCLLVLLGLLGLSPFILAML